ncbi:hypothetical protein [Pseudidiomarina terrestris]|uniref:Uncharacterized protein n=1 Tax=Pseudidiomarina terrestris TaxID=2820060 RepID=A0AAW7R2N4_9GAMM|nr:MULTISPECIES: hypothetical protein [unclassified Pseudidiomarina]MDN7125373.1 hypothetical protein [Pseudidiomarina sp. 1APP75-32.1]MDN7127977.1 hypothetical protein [Pseudidiomarina sp. 1APR75-33.1]MDN7130131.1 hypothetical protein [Pseudidiomarina sp. 1APR75-15]MDN7135636.1 hypothetical protein [Pseudidiomarina sp. 1ASP75-5]MDN7137326.1 hypothetical protein [Pseudidiomarina sp. 1ASP75-14]
MSKAATILAMLMVYLSADVCANDSFEGVIEYKIQSKALIPEIPQELLDSTYGNSQTIYYGKGGHFRIETNSTVGNWEIYRADENKQYIKTKPNAEIEVFDASEENRVLKHLTVKDAELKVLGRNTKLIEIAYEDGSISRYWYAPSLYINPEPYENLKFAYYDRYWEIAKSPYLQHERIHDTWKVTYTAVNVVEKEVSDDLFQPQ